MVILKVPATTANLGPGFDTLGMALGNMFNYVELEEIEQGLEIKIYGEGIDLLPTDKTNLAYRAAMKVFERADYRPSGLKIELQNNIPISRGLGSSASVIIGGMVAANYVSGNRLNNDQILYMASEMEGSPDNVAAALLGGIVVTARAEDEIIYKKITPPTGLTSVVAIPDFELSTKEARSVLPKKVAIKDAVFNISNTALLVYAMMENDMDLLKKVMDDKLHQPYRASLIPGMQEVMAAAKDNDALAVALSGAGPTIIAFCTVNCKDKIAIAMKKAFHDAGIRCKTEYLSINAQGMEILKREGEKK